MAAARKRKAESLEDLRLPGPGSVQELFQYPDASLELLVDAAQCRLWGLEDAIATLQRNIQEGIDMTTAYSGVGTAEMSGSVLLEALFSCLQVFAKGGGHSRVVCR
jgi:hypothetical protein